jgi:hypothetical protein
MVVVYSPRVRCPFSSRRPYRASQPRVGGWWVAQVSSTGVVYAAGPSQHLLARLFYRSAIILHHAPGPSGSAPPPPKIPYCSFARRVHVEPRPPNIEKSSEFSRALAGKDGSCQGRNVPSPPPTCACTARADNTIVLLTCSSLGLDQLVWEQQSAFIRL